MKILIVGGKQAKHEAERYYNYVNKLINGFIRAGHHVQHISDRDTARNSNFFKRKKLGIKKCNAILIKYIAEYKPDVVLFKHADVIQPETLAVIKEKFPQIKLAQVNVDALFNPDNVARIKKKSGLVDANFMTSAGSVLNKCKVNDVPCYHIPNIVDTAIESHRAFEKDDLAHDIFFACGAAYDGELRKEIKTYVAEDLPNVNFAYYCIYEGTKLWGAEYMDTIGNSRIGLNLSRYSERGREGNEEDFYMYSSDRLAHYIGNGLLIFSDTIFALDKLYSADEMVFFSGKEDLMQKLKYHLEHPEKAKEIAERGWQKSVKEYNSEKCAQFILDVLFKKDEDSLKSTYLWYSPSLKK